jgi:molybdate transport system substrate-binding protein
VRRLLALAAVAAVLLAGCGDDGDAAAGSDRPRLVVSAAASLKAAFTAYGDRFPPASPRFSFAGSDDLAAQIEQGVKPDVFAAADTTLPDELHAKGLVERPTVFAGNRLVLAVPAGEGRIAALGDLARGGVKLAIGDADVPVGAYTRTVLERLPGPQRAAILANVRTEEPDVAGITGKLIQGAVDAGFLYVSDVRAAGGDLRAIELAEELQPSVAYGAAVVKGAKRPAEARAFVAGLLEGAGAQALRAAGFEPPPGR